MDMPYWAAPGTPLVTTGGSLPAASYSVRAAYTYSGGVGILSPSVMVAVASGQQISVPSPPADAAGLATGWNIYIGPSGNETLQNSSPLPIGTAFTLNAAPSTNLGIVPLGCSAFCHPLYRFQFLGGPPATQGLAPGLVCINGILRLRPGRRSSASTEAAISRPQAAEAFPRELRSPAARISPEARAWIL